jgi:hypothetical protein
MLVAVDETWTTKRWFLFTAIRPAARVEVHLAPAFRKVQYGMSCGKIKRTPNICSLQLSIVKDSESRLRFCRWVLHKIMHEPDILSRELWTDKAALITSGTKNLHN